MIHQVFDRTSKARRTELNASLGGGFGRILDSIAESFEALHRIQWSAPWAPNSRNVRCG